MTAHAAAFDRWIRTSFVEMNTTLENLYFAQEDRARVEGVGDTIKGELRDAGRVHVRNLLAEGKQPTTGSTAPSACSETSASISAPCGGMN